MPASWSPRCARRAPTATLEWWQDAAMTPRIPRLAAALLAGGLVLAPLTACGQNQNQDQQNQNQNDQNQDQNQNQNDQNQNDQQQNQNQ